VAELERAAQRKPARIAAPLRQQVVTLISEAIAVGDHQPGDRLIERDLCERYEVSRTVIREALRHLEAQGLIEIVPNRGPVVATVSPEEAAWLYEVRANLEALAAECFAERSTPAEKKRIAAAVEDVAAYTHAQDMIALLASKDEFYDVLFEGAHNPIIAGLLKTLHVRIRLMRSLSLSAPGRGEHTMSELRAIVAALTKGDGGTASTLAKQHVESAARVVLSRLSERGGDADGLADGTNA
jgi:DNA-binding GntR family transcriptional regulator